MKGACIACKHHVHSGGGHLCQSPKFADPVTGEAVKACRQLREVPWWVGGCGRNGKFFVSKVEEMK